MVIAFWKITGLFADQKCHQPGVPLLLPERDEGEWDVCGFRRRLAVQRPGGSDLQIALQDHRQIHLLLWVLPPIFLYCWRKVSNTQTHKFPKCPWQFSCNNYTVNLPTCSLPSWRVATNTDRNVNTSDDFCFLLNPRSGIASNWAEHFYKCFGWLKSMQILGIKWLKKKKQPLSITSSVLCVWLKKTFSRFCRHKTCLLMLQCTFSHFCVFYRPDYVVADHGEDVEYVFGQVRDVIRGATLDERRLSHAVMSAWTNFARSGYERYNFFCCCCCCFFCVYFVGFFTRGLCSKIDKNSQLWDAASGELNDLKSGENEMKLNEIYVEKWCVDALVFISIWKEREAQQRRACQRKTKEMAQREGQIIANQLGASG